MDDTIKFIDLLAKKIISDNLTPGLGIAIVSSDKIYMCNTYGLSEIYAKSAYTTSTTILLASVSKVLTSTILCMLEKIYPGKLLNANANIKTPEPFITQNMLVKDVISHRSGIPEQFGTIAESLGLHRSTIMDSLHKIDRDMFKNFRNGFTYTNIPFTFAVESALRNVNLTFKHVYDELFATLKMNETSISGKYYGYGKINSDKKWYPNFNAKVAQQVAAGGIYSTVTDMAKFLQFHLGQCKKPMDERSMCNEFYEALVARGNDFYGIGLNINYKSYGGHIYKSFNHSGALDNTRTVLEWFPDLDIGIFIHANSASNGIPEAMAHVILSKFFGMADDNAIEIFNEVEKIVDEFILQQLCPIAYIDELTLPYVAKLNDSLTGMYQNDFWGHLYIIDNLIKFKNLRGAHLYTLDSTTYGFIMRDVSDVPFAGNIKMGDKDTLIVTYANNTEIFQRIKL